MPKNDEKELFYKDCVIRDSGQVLSYGEKLVGLDFNPSGDETVHQIKVAFAYIINVLQDSLNPNPDDLNYELKNKAIMSIIEAQMWSSKAITFNN